MRLPESEAVNITFPFPCQSIDDNSFRWGIDLMSCLGVRTTGCYLIDLFGWLELMACSLDDRVLFPFPEQMTGEARILTGLKNPILIFKKIKTC